MLRYQVRRPPGTICDQENMAYNLGLNVGQLVRDEYFTLFEAVGALEVRIYQYGASHTDESQGYEWG